MSVFDKHIGHPIDTSTWKEFKVEDLFTVENGHCGSTGNSEGTVAIINASAVNNGVLGYYDVEPKYENRITIVGQGDGGAGVAFYHPFKFNATSCVRILLEKFEGLNKYIGCFLCAIFTKKFHESGKYNFSNGLGKAKLERETIKLPATESGEPDWAFMDQTMRNLWDKVKINFSTENHAHQIDTSEWKEFKLPDLFTITGTRTTKHVELSDTKSNETPYPYITTAATNNGVCGYSNIYTEKGNVITVDSAVLGKTFYQEYDFTASDHVEKLIPKYVFNKYVALFICAILDKNAKSLGYNYGKKRSQRALKLETIKLPVTESGEPDWAFMENLMKDVERRSLLIQHLKKGNEND